MANADISVERGVCSCDPAPAAIRENLVDRKVERLRAQCRNHLLLNESNLMQAKEERNCREISCSDEARVHDSILGVHPTNLCHGNLKTVQSYANPQRHHARAQPSAELLVYAHLAEVI